MLFQWFTIHLMNTLCWGFVYSKDVRLPIQLQRAMAAEAEASREARAKVCLTYFEKKMLLR